MFPDTTEPDESENAFYDHRGIFPAAEHLAFSCAARDRRGLWLKRLLPEGYQHQDGE